jgi:hypothetical protein
MLNHHKVVQIAHDENDLLMGTVESWIVYVGIVGASLQEFLISAPEHDRRY